MRALIAAGLMAGMAVFGGAGVAHADYTRADINRGLCAYLDGGAASGYGMATLNSIVQAGRVADWPIAATGLVLRDSVRKVCPRHIPLVNRWGNEYHTVARYGYAPGPTLTLPPYQYEFGEGLYLGLN